MAISDAFLLEVSFATWTTFRIYFIAWITGTASGILIGYMLWRSPRHVSSRLYLLFSGISFIPVTIWIPYFVRGFGLEYFVYPLLAVPVALITLASMHEAFEHTNRHRITLLVNYQQNMNDYFWTVVFRESMPALKTVSRHTLSLCFAIFIALDYFMEYWSGLGALVQKYYSRLSFDEKNHIYMLLTIAITGILGFTQVYFNNLLFKRWTEFRKHY